MKERINYPDQLASLLEEWRGYGWYQAEEVVAAFEHMLRELDETDIQALLRAAEQPEIAEFEVAILGAIGDERAVPPLLAHLDDPSGWTWQLEVDQRRLCLNALVSIAIRLGDPDVNAQVIDRLVHYFFDRRYDEHFLSPGTHDLRCYYITQWSIEALGRLGDERVIPLLLPVLASDHTPSIVEAAIEALVSFGDASAIPVLIDLVKQQHYSVHAALDALARLRQPEAVPGLLEALDRGLEMEMPDEVKASILWTLGELEDPRAVPALLEIAETHDKDMRAAAIEALGKIRDPAAVPALIAYLGDDTVLNRQDYAGTLFLFQTYRGKRVASMAIDALLRIGTEEAQEAVANLFGGW